MEDFSIVYEYSRTQALADGVLVDVTKLAREAGFLYPVALTAPCWERCVRVPDEVLGQDEIGRLWDVLIVLLFRIESLGRLAALGGTAHLDRAIEFCVAVLNESDRPETVQMKAIIGPGDNAEPVITIMLPEED